MACKCIKDIKERLMEHYKDNLNIKTINFENEAYFSDGLKLYLPVIIHHETTTKKGIVKYKKQVVNMYAKYCPFCGKAYGEANHE